MKPFGDRLSDGDCGDMFKLLTNRFDRPKEASADLGNLAKSAFSLGDSKTEKRGDRRGASGKSLDSTNKSLFGAAKKGAN